MIYIWFTGINYSKLAVTLFLLTITTRMKTRLKNFFFKFPQRKLFEPGTILSPHKINGGHNINEGLLAVYSINSSMVSFSIFNIFHA